MEDEAMEEPVMEHVDGPEPMDADAPDIQEAPTVAPKPVDPDSSGEHEWVINDFSKRADEKIYSEKFDIGTYIWRMLVFPSGNRAGSNFLSVFLDAPEAQYTPAHLNPKASFKLILVNHLDASKSFVKDTSHTFTEAQNDWGFAQFINVEEVRNPANGFITPDDKLVLKVHIEIQKDDKYAYDSRKETGFVGLKNQGATCYMNSLLQYLYNLHYFRKAVYHMPTQETDEPSKSLPLALQSLFYKLQYSKTPVATKDLTKSFGWGTYDAFMQHDVQELNRVLCEKLEDKMKGTTVERVINDLFEGHTLNYIRCLHVDYQSERKESFMDLQLDVRGCATIADSFLKYCEEEVLSGDNKYNAEGHGLQDAKKGVKFVDLPPVLQLQLKRFEYDMHRDAMVKINDRYEFSDVLDLEPHRAALFAGSSDPSVPARYKLFAVLVHSGGVHGGHYYAFIRPGREQWLRFDDDRVTLESDKAAMEDQFGAEEVGGGGGGYGQGGGLRFNAKHSNAYMLVYIREADWDRVMCAVTAEDIATHVRSRLQREQADKEARHKEKAEAHLYVTLKVATNETFRQQIDGGQVVFDLCDHDALEPGGGLYRVRKHTKFSEFKARLAEERGIPLDRMRFWVWSRRPNSTYRVAAPLKPEEEELQLMDLRHYKDSQQAANPKQRALLDLCLWLELPSGFKTDLTKTLLAKAPDSVLLFIKEYNPWTEKLTYKGHCILPKTAKVGDMVERAFRKTCSFLASPTDTRQVQVVEEIKKEPTLIVKLLDPRSTFDKQEVVDGDICVLQPALAEEEAAALARPTIEAYFEYVRARRLVCFRRLEEPKEEGFVLELTQDSSYDDVARALAGRLGLEPGAEEGALRLRLTTHSAYVNAPARVPVRFRAFSRLSAILQHQGLAHTHSGSGGGAGAPGPNDILYYEVLDMPLEQLEQLKAIKLTWHKEGGDPVSEHLVRLPPESKVEAALAELGKQVGAAAEKRPLRLLEVHSSRIYKVVPGDEAISSLDDSYWRLRAEAVPEEEEAGALGPEDRLLHCYHYHLGKASAGGAASPARGSANNNNSGVSRGGSVGADMDAEQDQGQGQAVAPAAQPLGPAPAPGGAAAQGPVLFGDPLLVRCGPHDTLASVRARVQAKLGASDEALSKWRWSFWSVRTGLTYLGDGDDVGGLLGRALAGGGPTAVDGPYLGMEHDDDKPRRQPNTYRMAYEKAIKIHS
uniref:ubiquitinyl hydrolase 1 n=1 Tax=Chlamydomonas leiostraca TaxID=1034604 RepID=A0A7S0WIA5_9CHLO|mmetsp:Transcript_14772/g.36857  ORF Transcript_14772/g.36857 Transcript_14772/m.36857 type:complete len:1211 (+) Transcript_14772:82-3714(+)